MTKLTFYGATGTVTGSRFLLDIETEKWLIDCGMFQGGKKNRLKNWEKFPQDPKSIDRVLLTHAHIDHSAYLPRLVKDGFAGKVHCTHSTKALCKIMLRDSAKLQEEDAYWANKRGFSKHKPALPLYTMDDTEMALDYFEAFNYGEDFFPFPTVRVKFKDAGHILGSSFIDIKRVNTAENTKILFSGDFGRPDRPVLRDPTQVFNVDYLVLESTYGDRLHQESFKAEELIRVVKESMDRGGILLIPAFSVGRTQTLLYVLRELEEQGEIPSIPVYMDSPMAIKVTNVFNSRISDHNLTTRVQTLQGKKVFQPSQLHLCSSRDESKAINGVRKNAIVISASGMATGGRILHHLVARLSDPKNTILFMGYQARGTRGRTILEGKPEVKIHGRKIPVNAHVEKISAYSGHGDYNEILAWLMAFNKAPKKTFLVHGEPEARLALKEKIKAKFDWDVVIPEFGDSYDLDF